MHDEPEVMTYLELVLLFIFVVLALIAPLVGLF
jgi:hypothetical protein